MTIWEAIQEEQARRRAERPQRVSNAPAIAAILGSDIGAALGARGLTRGLLNNGVQIPMHANTPFHQSMGGLDMLMLARRAGLDVQPEMLSGGENAFFRPAFVSRLLGRPTGQHGTIGRTGAFPDYIPADVAAHEVGHGVSWSGKAGLLPKLISRARIPGQLGAGIASLLGLLKGTSGEKSLAEREKWLNTASIAGGVGMAPVLADEALASRNALRILRSVPPSLLEKEVAQQAVRRLARAFGSYGLTGLGLVLGPQLAKEYYRRRHE
jgi:hypothetical protein